MQGWVTWPGSLLATASCHDNVQHPVKNYKACWEIELLSKWNNRKQTPTHISEIGNLYIQDSGGNEEQNRCINGAFQELEYICLTSYHWKIQCLWWGTQWLGAPEDTISALGNRAMKNTQGRAQQEWKTQQSTGDGGTKVMAPVSGSQRRVGEWGPGCTWREMVAKNIPESKH